MTNPRTEAVIAGNFRQYMEWLRDNDDGKTSYRYITQAEVAERHQFDDYHVIGSATDRADFGELLAAVKEARKC